MQRGRENVKMKLEDLAQIKSLNVIACDVLTNILLFLK